mmetsp:Transcript_51999/g.62553  ORF Transcript_51999/g.62553 Transcript_51999/m.62553 type:complete len:99 (-) Transcript_51999:311-607(-)
MAPSTPPPPKHCSFAALTIVDLEGLGGYENVTTDPSEMMRENGFSVLTVYFATGLTPPRFAAVSELSFLGAERCCIVRNDRDDGVLSVAAMYSNCRME